MVGDVADDRPESVTDESKESPLTCVLASTESRYIEPVVLKIVAAILRILFFVLSVSFFGAAFVWLGLMIFTIVDAVLRWNSVNVPLIVASLLNAVILVLDGKWCFRVSLFFKPL